MDTLKAEKDIAMRRYRRFRQLCRAVRFVEAAAALLLLTWSSTRLPAAVKTFGELLLAAGSMLVKPCAVFLIGNVIVVLLLSGKLSSPSSSSKTSSAADESWYWGLPESAATASAPAAEEVVYEDKAVCVETPRRQEYRRSRSEKVKGRREDANLRRAESEIKAKPAAAAEIEGVPAAEDEKVGAEDAEEFQRTIEAFIAEQLRFRREESIAVVSCSPELPKQIAVKD